MSIQNQQTPTQSFAPPPAQPKSGEQGTWLFYDQAVIATGKSEKTLKRYVKKGELPWRRMGKQINSPVQVWITPDLLAIATRDVTQNTEDAEIFDADPQESDLSASTEQAAPAPNSPEASEDPHERIIKLMVTEFSTQLDKQRDVLFGMRKELHETQAQLLLLPDLQRQLEEREREARYKAEALEKEMEVLKESLEQQAKEAELLQSENEDRSKALEELRAEQEQRAKILEELQQENERLRLEAEQTKNKKTWWKWFLGDSQT
ncbi:MAG: hypothetical protein K2X81_00020 [Candidatus Obscuribacterales bacterium]|nr:hypothetical protein [Candidatus Obscuribacterales bacterium]